jgi:hypothetical protein
MSVYEKKIDYHFVHDGYRMRLELLIRQTQYTGTLRYFSNFNLIPARLFLLNDACEEILLFDYDK